VKEPGCSLPRTFSPEVGLTSGNSLARSVSGVKTGAPAGV